MTKPFITNHKYTVGDRVRVTNRVGCFTAIVKFLYCDGFGIRVEAESVAQTWIVEASNCELLDPDPKAKEPNQ